MDTRNFKMDDDEMKRFTAKIDWEDSGWFKLDVANLYYVRIIGPTELNIFLNPSSTSFIGRLTISGSDLNSNPYTSLTSAKRGCERALRRLLK